MSVVAPPAPPPAAPVPPEPRPAASVAEERSPDRSDGTGWREHLTDAAGLGAVALVALSGLGPAYGGLRYLVVGGVGLVLGMAGAAVAAHRRVPLWIVALATLAIDVLVGACLVGSDRALAVVVPSATTVEDMVVGAVRGWANLVTTTVPVGAAQQLLVVPWVSGLVVGVASMSISRRAAGRAWALLALGPPLALLVGGILMGVAEPAWDGQATVFVLAALLWGSWRQRSARTAGMSRGRRSRLASAVAVLAVTAAVGLVVGRSAAVLGPEERFVLRDHVEPPVDLRRLPSPLEGFRRFRTDDRRDDVLFTVEGLRADDRLRLATLDHYDGTIWHVQGGTAEDTSSGFFQRVGEELPVSETGDTRSLVVEIGEYTGAWVPNMGATAQVRFEGRRAAQLSEGFRYNMATDTAAEPGGLRPGDRYRLEVVVPETGTDPADGDPDLSAVVPDPEPVDIVRERVAELAEAAGPGASALERARAVEDWFRSEDGAADPRERAYFSDGDLDVRIEAGLEPPASRPGHGAERMRALLDDEGFVVGNEEQFASAMALLAHELGLPARVVVGFVPEITGDGAVEVRGEDISAWTEVAVAGAGWVPLDPTPVNLEIPVARTDDPRTPPDRYLPPPPTTVPQVALPTGGRDGAPCEEECDVPEPGSPLLPSWVGPVALFGGTPLALLGGGTALLAGLKRLRRERRRSRGVPGTQVAAAWAEVLDLSRDLGDVVPVRATRREVAVLLARPGVADLARSADALLFGPDDIAPEMAALYWREADTARAAMVDELSILGRWKTLVNPTSLRRSSSLGGLRGRVDAALAWRPRRRRTATGPVTA